MKSVLQTERASPHAENAILPASHDSATEAILSSWVNEYSDRLFRHALLRVSNRELAEDLVQETFLSAVKNVDGFESKSSPYTWLFAILKNKIIDHIRKDSRAKVESLGEDVPDWQEALFNRFGLWKLSMSDWDESPDELLERKRFREMFDECLLELPAKHRQAFALKVLDQVPTEEVCSLMNVTQSNLWVILYRARMALRKSINDKWFDSNEKR